LEAAETERARFQNWKLYAAQSLAPGNASMAATTHAVKPNISSFQLTSPAPRPPSLLLPLPLLLLLL
jgi:hypothetical protein